MASYKILLGGSEGLNNIAVASRRQVKEALRRAYKLGEVVNQLLEIIEKLENSYLNYCKLMKVMGFIIEMHTIEMEIEDTSKLDN